jgi:hypothetical protein
MVAACRHIQPEKPFCSRQRARQAHCCVFSAKNVYCGAIPRNITPTATAPNGSSPFCFEAKFCLIPVRLPRIFTDIEHSFSKDDVFGSKKNLVRRQLNSLKLEA